MEIIIEVGDVSKDYIYKYNGRYDDVSFQLNSYYEYLIEFGKCVNNCEMKGITIVEVDVFMLAALIAGVTAFVFKDKTIPQFDPAIYRAYEVSRNGEKRAIYDEKGNHNGINYYDKLMGRIMDDYYKALNNPNPE